MPNYYELLGLNAENNPTTREIQKAYHTTILAIHPDKKNTDNSFADEALTKKVIEAYSVLKDDEQRKVYDKKLALEREKEANKKLVASYTEKELNIIRRGFLNGSVFDFVRMYSDGDDKAGAAAMKGDKFSQEDAMNVSFSLAQKLKKLNFLECKEALITSTEKLQRDHFSKAYTCGSTFCFAALTKEREKKTNQVRYQVITAHIGDTLAKAIVVDDKGVVLFERLTEPHDNNGNKRCRLWGGGIGINIARSLGDVYVEIGGLKHNAEVIKKPFTYTPKKGQRFLLVVGCDGLTDFVNDEAIKKIVWQYRAEECDFIAKKLVEFAYCQGYSSDNISVVVTDSEAAVLVCDGHGGHEVSTEAAEHYFALLNKEINEFLNMPTARRETYIKKMAEEKARDPQQLLRQSREAAIQTLLERKVPDHILSIRKGFPLKRYLNFETELSDSTLLEKVSQSLAKFRLSRSPIEEYSKECVVRGEKTIKKVHQITIPLTKDVAQLMPSFDLFLGEFQSLLHRYQEERDREVRIGSRLSALWSSVPAPSARLVGERKKNISSTVIITVESDDKDELIDGSSANKVIKEWIEAETNNREINSDGRSLSKLKNIPVLDKKELSIQKISTETTEIVVPSLLTQTPLLALLDEKKEPMLSSLQPMSSGVVTEYKTVDKRVLEPLNIEEFHETVTNLNFNDGSIHYIASSKNSYTFAGKYEKKDQPVQDVVIKCSWMMEKLTPDVFTLAYLNKHSSSYFMKLIGVSQAGGRPRIVMEAAALGTVDRFLETYYKKNSEKIPFQYLVKIAHDIAHGLADLHALGLCHRDFRTENVYLTDLGAKIAGFSYAVLAKNTWPEGYSFSSGSGSNGLAEAMFPPEVFLESDEKNEVPTPRRRSADIYAFGMILRELFDTPPHRKTFEGIKRDISSFVTSGRKEVIPADCDPDIAKIMVSCWSTDRKQRPTAKKLAETFEAILQELNQQQSHEIALDFKITPPFLYNGRIAGSFFGHTFDKEYHSAKEKLYDLLYNVHLASPQNCFAVQKTLYADRLALEFEALLKAGLDEQLYLDAIFEHLPKHADKETPLLADIIRLTQDLKLDNHHSYRMIFEFPEEKELIYTMLSVLSDRKKELCTNQNLAFIIENRKMLPGALEQIKTSRLLTPDDFEKLFAPPFSKQQSVRQDVSTVAPTLTLLEKPDEEESKISIISSSLAKIDESYFSSVKKLMFFNEPPNENRPPLSPLAPAPEDQGNKCTIS